MKEQIFYISGMSCAACSSGVERSLGRKNYCQKIEVDLLSTQAKITYDENLASLEQIFVFIEKMGYKPSLTRPDSEISQSCAPNSENSTDSKNPTDSENSLNSANPQSAQNQSLLDKFNALDKKLLPPKLRLIFTIFFSAIVLAFALHTMFWGHIISNKIDCAIMLFGSLVVMHMGREFYFKGFKALFAQNPTMDTLIAISTSAAFLYSALGAVQIFISDSHLHLYFESVSVIICFVMIGKFIENASKNSAQKSANLLLEINQKRVLKLKNDDLDSDLFAEILAKDIQKGDIIKVLPGDLVVVDGILVKGNALLDESSISGESVPVAKKVGDFVSSAAVNLQSAFLLKAQNVGANSALNQIFELIQNAGASKAGIQSLADKVSGIFVPCVIFIAFVAGVVWWGIQDFTKGLEIFISVLVISCPCALGLATPMAFLHSRAVAYKMGVFFKSAQCLETLSNIKHIVFDKTGTLTKGLEVQNLRVFENLDSEISESKALEIIASLEANANHIIATSILDFAQKQGVKTHSVSDFEQIEGFGVKGCVNGEQYILGSLESVKNAKNFAQVANDDFKAAVYLMNAHKLCVVAALYLKDLPRNDVRFMIERFGALGVGVVMLTGDDEKNAQKVARDLGISSVMAGVKPAGKLEFVQKCKRENGKVLMVGDGINDAAALGAADVSMAYAQNDVAQSCADVILYNQNSKAILNAYLLAISTIKNVKQNLFWAFGYNALFIPIACGVLGFWGLFLDPMFCALAMSASSVSVVLNAARIRKFRAV